MFEREEEPKYISIKQRVFLDLLIYINKLLKKEVESRQEEFMSRLSKIHTATANSSNYDDGINKLREIKKELIESKKLQKQEE